tara:strand:- start:9222 stop:10124 length:903 start_codon:yes stop_codon:yes gene_type:complete
MRILSWDVGIKNLAFCLIDTTENNKIIDWGVINLIEDEDLKCHGFINSNNEQSDCCKKITYEYINGTDTYYFCNLHKRQFEKIEKNVLNITSYKGEETCTILKSNKKTCEKKAVFCIEDFNSKIKSYCCKIHHNNLIKKNNILRKKTKQNVNKIPIEIVKLKLIKALDKKNFENINYVLIENQPSLKNPKMKSIAETLYAWFLIRGLVDHKIENLQNIYYISPSNKLKIDDVDLNKEIDKLKDSSKKYKFTKNASVVHTKSLIENDKFWYDYLCNHSKKDDLCDSYLQGMYFIKNENKFI